MAKKIEIPKDFNLDDIMGGKVEDKSNISGTKIIGGAEDIDEEALLEFVVRRKINNTISQKEERTELDSSDIAGRSIQKTVPAKQRKTDLLNYQQTFLSVPKITDRETAFISNELRERIVSIVRRLGTEKSSVSGFIENLVTHHLEEYKNDIESWKKL